MSRKNTKKRNSNTVINARRTARKQVKAATFNRRIAIFSLLILLVVCLVSTTFATFDTPTSESTGSLIADIRTAVVNKNTKEDLVNTGANVDVTETSATITGGTVFYLSPSSNWKEANAWFAAYFCNGSSSAQWVRAEEDSATGYYKVTVPSGQSHANIIWCRMNPASTSLDWSNKWTQTADLTWDGSNNLYTVSGWDSGSWSTPAIPFNVGDIVYFDIRNNTSWLTADSTSKMYIQFNNSTTGSTSTSDRAELTQIGEYLYMYKFTKTCSSSIRFWRGNSSSMWNYSKSLTKTNGNCVYIASGGWSGSGTEATLTLTSITTPTLTITPSTVTVGDTAKLVASSVTPVISYKIGSTAYTTNAVSSDIKYSFKRGTTSIATVDSSGTYNYVPTTAGTYSITATISSTATGLSATSTAKTLTVKAKLTFTVSANKGGTVSPTSGSVADGESVTITATANDGYTFAGWINASNGTVTSATSASTSFKPTATGATVTAAFRPDTPSKLTLTGSPVASGTTGTGTSGNPYIVFAGSGFTLTANATVVTDATPMYSASEDGPFVADNTFEPSLSTKGTSQSYDVYAVAAADGYESDDYIKATAYYMVFSHLNGANTGFTLSSNSITDADTLTLSGKYVNGVDTAEKSHITQKYQISTNNSSFTDLSSENQYTWTPNTTGTYYFRVKTTNNKTGETVYSTSQSVTVIQSTVYYDITITNKGSLSSTSLTLKTDGTTITDNSILSNSPLTLSISRSANHYFEYITVDDGTTIWSLSNYNGNITDELVLEHVKGNVSIEYKLAAKPQVTVELPANASSISFKYKFDGVDKTATAAGTYYVDYNSAISYSVTPKAGYYVSSMTGVTMDPVTAGTNTGKLASVTQSISKVTANVIVNNSVTVNVDTTSASTDGASMTIDGATQPFGTAKPLNYGAEATVVITPPEDCYALVSGNSVNATIGTDGKATFNVTITNASKTYTVKFVKNPKIYMVQPQFGSVYVTDDAGNYYINGDSVGYGTELTVHAKKDHGNAKLVDVLVNDASIGTTDGSTFNIYEDSTASATITVDSKHTFADSTEYGNRRIFFTDNSTWGDGQVMVHYSNTDDDTSFSDSHTKAMTYKFTNDASQRVYYADIPYSYKYVNFYKKNDTSKYTDSALISNDANAYWHNGGTAPYAINKWQENYSDYIATDRETSIQQATTFKNSAVEFEYSCDFGDGALSAELVSGNPITYDFHAGTLTITPTENTDNYSLVKVTSSASTTVKYYLIRVESFEIVSFAGLQKIYSTSVFNNIQLDLILTGGALNYAAKYMVSDSNISGTYTEITGRSSGFEYVNSLQAYINSFLIEYAINAVSGVKYYQVEASDASGYKATDTMKTLFGTNNHLGKRTVYFYNDTNVDITKFNLRACFFNSNGGYTWSTMQRVGNTNYYRATVPSGYEFEVKFYLCNKNTFSTDYQYFDGFDDTTEYYTFSVKDAVDIPALDGSDNALNEYANLVYAVSSISTTNGIVGDFTEFDY